MASHGHLAIVSVDVPDRAVRLTLERDDIGLSPDEARSLVMALLKAADDVDRLPPDSEVVP